MTRAALPHLADPRTFQIAALSLFLAFGWSMRAFEIAPMQFAAILATALAVQGLGSFLYALKFEAKSAIITSLSLTLLLRADAVWPLMMAAAIGVGSKFALRLNGKHIFNPANIGLVATIILTSAAWTTPGQWGTAVWLAALISGFGFFVTFRASRIDVPLIFLSAYAALIFARALWLGDPLVIPMNRLQNGALILFAFFMISDPKTTPDGFLPRALFCIATALLAFVLQYKYFISDGLFYALAVASLFRPLIELFDKSPLYRWSDPPAKLVPELGAKPKAPQPAE